MVRDFVAGLLWGGVVASAGLGVISQVSPLPLAPIAGSETVEPAPEAASPPTAPASVEETTAPVASNAPPPDTTAPDTQMAAADPQPADPVPSAPDATDAAPSVPQSATAPSVTEAEAAPAPLAPSAPAGIPDTAPETAPGALDGSAGSAPQAPGQDAQPTPAGAAAQVAIDTPDDTLPNVDEPPSPQAGMAEAPNDTLLTPAAPAEDLPLPGQIQPDPDPLPQIQPAEPPAPEAVEPEPAAPLPALIVPDGGQRLAPDPGLKLGESSRLPSIAETTEPEAAPPQVAPSDLPAVARYAATFENPGNKPAFAILLVDTGAADVDRVKLAALPFPVTFVLDPQAANAAEAAATYRSAGKEVIMLATGIPDGATAADLEQTFQSNASALPESVAVIDLAEGGFQDNRPLATQVVPILKAEGRGLITFDKGLNAADQVARREDVPSAVVFRTLDGEGEDAPIIRRYLDRAAFKAAQDGRVVVIGTVRLETVAAILEWTVEGRASSVILAPATAVLRVE